MIYLVSNQTRCIEDPEIKTATLEDCLNYFEDKKEIGLDIETRGFDPYTKEILSIQLGDYENQFIFDGNYYILALRSLLEDESKLILGQNLKFDLRFFLHYGIIINNVYDTYIAEQIIWNGYDYIRKRLDYLVDRYCGEYIDKSIRGNIHKEGLSLSVIKYATDDVKYLSEIKRKQLEKAQKLDVYRAIELNNMFVPVIAYLEYCGFKLDKNKWEEKIEVDTAELNKQLEILNQFIIDQNMTEFIDSQLDLFNPERKVNINWNSPIQVAKFFQQIGVNTEILDKESGELKNSVNSSVLKKQINKHPIVETYINYREALKRVSTYGKNWYRFINPVTGRIHTKFQQWMNTGRMSSGGKDQSGEKWPNAQNIPSDFDTRRCIVADEGNILINADYSSQEVRIFANKSKDEALLDMFAKGLEDQHSFTAWMLFEKIRDKYPEMNIKTLNRIKKEFEEERIISKQANFAIQYGGIGSTIANNCNVDLKTGEYVYNKYFEAYKGVKDYFNKTYWSAKKRGYILYNNITRGKYFIPKGLSDSKLKTRSYNYPIQATAADMIKYAGILYWRYLIENGLVFTVLITIICHDEYLLEAPKNLAEKEAEVLKECMEEAANRFCDVPKIPAEPTIENYWTH